jgi:hypothetical protein
MTFIISPSEMTTTLVMLNALLILFIDLIMEFAHL